MKRKPISVLSGYKDLFQEDEQQPWRYTVTLSQIRQNGLHRGSLGFSLIGDGLIGILLVPDWSECSSGEALVMANVKVPNVFVVSGLDDGLGGGLGIGRSFDVDMDDRDEGGECRPLLTRGEPGHSVVEVRVERLL